MLFLVLACICLGIAGGLIGWSLTTPPEEDPVFRPVMSRPAEAVGSVPREVQQTSLHDAMLERSRTERVVRPGLEKFQENLAKLTPDGRIKALHRTAITAGVQRKWTRARITLFKSIGLAFGVVFGLLLFVSLDGAMRWIMSMSALGVGYFGLDMYLKGQASQRQEQVLNDLPDITDQISISVQAGLGFEAAIQRVAISTDGPLSDELGRMLHDVRIGATRANAFRSLADRLQIDDLSSFVRAITQAEKSGVAIAQVLQVQADEQRERRRQRAEERAMKMPVLLVFPLVTCILPPLFIVLMGPVIIQITQGGLL